MATPTKRSPRTQLDATTPAKVTAAPDNGVPFGGDRESKQRPGRQLGYRIPEDVYQRLAAASQGTDVAMGRLVLRAIEAELKRLSY